MSDRGLMQVPIPTAEGANVSMRTGFGGVNETGQIDSGEITSGHGFTTAHLPEIRAIRTPKSLRVFTGEIITTAVVGDILLVVAFDGANTNLYYIRDGNMYVGTLAEGRDTRQRSIVQFNVYDDPTAITGHFTKKILVFPDKKTIDYDITQHFVLATMPDSVVPDIEYASVYNARLFGVKDGRVYASAFNSYAGWNLDTAEEYSDANAWMSETQSNPAAQNEFVAITIYDGHPVCFKPDYMQTIYNTKNPFRVVDVGEFGCVSNRAHTQCLGALYFVSREGVYSYTGGYPRRISDNLSVKDYSNAELASYGDEVYMNLNGTIYTYAPLNGSWAIGEVLGEDFGHMVSMNDGVYIFGGNNIFKLRAGAAHSPLSVELGGIAVQTTDSKRPKELALMYKLNSEGVVRLSISDSDTTAEKESSKVGTHSARLFTRGLADDIHSISIDTEGDATLYYLQYVYAKGGNTYGS